MEKEMGAEKTLAKMYVGQYSCDAFSFSPLVCPEPQQTFQKSSHYHQTRYGTKLTAFFASAEDAQAWLNHSSELQSLIVICDYYPAYDLEKAGRLSCLQMQVLLEGIKFARKLENL
jgi:hypothetical protein